MAFLALIATTVRPWWAGNHLVIRSHEGLLFLLLAIHVRKKLLALLLVYHASSKSCIEDLFIWDQNFLIVVAVVSFRNTDNNFLLDRRHPTLRWLHLNGSIFNFLVLCRSLTDCDGENNEISFAKVVPRIVLHENFKSVEHWEQFALKRRLKRAIFEFKIESWDGKAVISFNFGMRWAASIS